MADIDKITASNGTTYNIKDSTARDSISHWKSLNISSVTFNNSTGDGNLNILVNHTDGTSRIIVFSATGISYYENTGSGNVRKWQYIGS